MKRNLIMRKTAQLMMTSCLVCLFKIPVNASQFQLPLAAFSNGGISTNPSEVLLLNQEVQQLNTMNATLQSDVITLNQQIQQLNATAATLQDELNAALAGSDNIGTLVDTVNSMSNITTRLISQINNIKPSAGAVSTGVSDVMDLIGQPTGNATDSIYTRIGLAAQTDLTETLGGSSGTTISSRLGDPGSGNTLVGNIANGATSIQAAITTVQGNLAPLSNASLTPHHDLNRLLIDGNSSSTSGLVAKIAGNTSTTVLGGIEAVAASLDGSTSGSIAGTSLNSLVGKLATQLGNLKNGGTQLNTTIADINSQLGASGTTSARITSIDDSVLASPTGVLATDLSTLAAEIVTSPSGVVETDVHVINNLLNGTSTGSTIQARVTSIDNSILTTPTGVVSTDIASLASLIMTIPGSTLEGDVGSLNSLLNGTATGSTSQARINSAIGTIENGATQLTTAISDANTTLGGSGTTINRIYGVDALLDGVQTMSGLTSFTVLTAASNSSGTISIVGNDGSSGRAYSITFSSPITSGNTFILEHSGSGNTITFLNNSGGTLTSAANLVTYLAAAYPVNTVLKRTTATKATALKTFIGGTGYSSMSNALAIDAALLENPTGVIATDLTTLAAEIVTSPSGVVETDIKTLNSLLSGTAAGLTTEARIGSPMLGGSASNIEAVLGGTSTDIASSLGDPGSSKTLIGNIGGSTTSVQAALNVLSTVLVNNTSFSSSLTTQVTSLSTAVDNGLSSLPNSATTATISSIATSDGSGGVNVGFSGLGSANGTYNLAAATIAGSIGNGGTFTLTNASNNLVLVNRSGTTINTQAKAISYLASMYPPGSKIASDLSDKISSALNTLVGGTLSSIRARIAAADAAILVTPTGVLKADLSTLAGEIVTSPSAVLEGDIQTINSLLNGTSTGSTIQARIGSPTLNSTSSDLASIIGGSASDIVGRLGDPINGTSGLAGCIKNNGAALSTVNGFDCSSFDNATTLYDQLNAFLSIIGQSNSIAATEIVIPKGTYTDLRSLLAALNHD